MTSPQPIGAQVNPVVNDGIAKVFIGACQAVTVAQAKYLAREILAAAEWAAIENRITKQGEVEARIAAYRSRNLAAAR